MQLDQYSGFKYDAIFKWLVTGRCNLSCTYCTNRYKSDIKGWKADRKINIKKALKTLEDSGKIYLLSFTGGEPFLVENLIEASQELSKDHYLSFFSNLTTNKISEFVDKINPKKVYEFIGSLHIEQLEKLNLIERYISNFLLLKNNGFNIKADLVAYPSLVEKIIDTRNFFSDKGIYINTIPFKGKYENRKYPESYTEKELEMFGMSYDSDIKSFIYNQKEKICNAGYNCGVIHPDGSIYPCFENMKKIGNIKRYINFSNKLMKCPYDYCGCALNLFYPYLFDKAKKENNIAVNDEENQNIYSVKQEAISEKKLTSLKYCIITNNILQKKSNGPDSIASEYNWQNAFNGKIMHKRTALPLLKDGEFDIIHVILSKEDMDIVDDIRKRIGYNARTKIIATIKRQDFNNLSFSINFLNDLAPKTDLLFTSNRFSESLLLNPGFWNKFYVISNPVDIDDFESVNFKNKRKYISIIPDQDNINNSLLSFAIKDLGFKSKLFFNSKNAIPRDPSSIYDKTVFHEDYGVFCKELSESKIILIFSNEYDLSSGIIESVFMGIPVIAGYNVEIARKCYPLTTVHNMADIRKIRKIMDKLINDNDFHETVVRTAINNMKYYDYYNSKKRLLSILYEKTKDERFNPEKLYPVDNNKIEAVNNNKIDAVNNKILNFNIKKYKKICIKNIPDLSNHRSGWNFVVNILKKLHGPKGIILDGFIENTFIWREKIYVTNKTIPYKEKWTGFFHNPPNMPEWFFYESSPQNIIRKEIFKESLINCIGFFTLSEYEASYLRNATGKPVSTILHPTETPKNLFNFKKFMANNNKKIINIGWWLRKLNSIYLLPLDKKSGFTKVKLLPYSSETNDMEKVIMEKYISEEIKINGIRFQEEYYDNTKTISYLENIEYDEILSSNIVFLDLFDSNANNAIIECIARCTPVLVNPLPAVVEYLGPDYPFYFNSLEEARDKALNFDLINQTSGYLKKWHIREKLKAKSFFESFVNSEVYKLL